MTERAWPKWWGSLRTVLLTTIIVVPALFFMAIITWGMILVPVVGLLYLAPLALLHYALWGRSHARASEEAAGEETDGNRPPRPEDGEVKPTEDRAVR